MPFPTSSLAQSGRFTDIRPIGRGACGQVYVARDNLGRMVAIKEALPGDQEFAWVRAKFQKEARIQAALQHPNIVAIYSLEDDPETHELYLVCEYANGGSLAEQLATGCMPEAQAITVGRDICAALEATWRQLIVHRDVKPSNILLIKDATDTIIGAKLGDFGVAQDQKQRRTTLLPGLGHPGTPLYMPPEQGNIATVLDVRADLYALGVTLWEMQAGRDLKLLPSARDVGDLQAQHPPISPGMAAVIWRAAQPDREQRYATPAEMSNELAAVRDGIWAPARATIALPRGQQAIQPRHESIGWPQRARRLAWLAGLLVIVGLMALLLIPFRSSSDATTVSAIPDQSIAVIAAQKPQLAPACFKQQLASSGAPAITVGAPVAALADSRDLAKVGQLIARWDAQTQAIHVAFSPDGQTFATVLADGTIQLWAASGGKPLRVLCMPPDGDPSMATIAFAPDGQVLAAASGGGTIQLWHVSDGALAQSLDIPAQGLVSIAFAPDGRTFAASVDKGTTVQLFQLEGGKPLRTIISNAPGAAKLVFSPDGQILGLGLADGGVQLWRTSDGQALLSASTEQNDVPELAFAPDSRTLAVGLANGSVQLWKLDGTILHVLTGDIQIPVHAAFAPDGQMLATARLDGKVDLWDVGDGALLRTLDGGPTKGRASLSFSPDSKSLVVAWEAGTIELWGLPAKPGA
jgi:serine/threonine protein kinase/WD40 repeat protein